MDGIGISRPGTVGTGASDLGSATGTFLDRYAATPSLPLLLLADTIQSIHSLTETHPTLLLLPLRSCTTSSHAYTLPNQNGSHCSKMSLEVIYVTRHGVSATSPDPESRRLPRRSAAQAGGFLPQMLLASAPTRSGNRLTSLPPFCSSGPTGSSTPLGTTRPTSGHLPASPLIQP